MGVRSQLRWLVQGQADTTSTLEALSADVRNLQERIDALQQHIAAELDTVGARQLNDIDAIRDSVTAAVDDLSTRIAAMQRRQDGR